MKRFAIQSGEALVLAAVGVGLGGYIVFRCARGAWHVARQVFVEFVSG
jgi:hypothetical protein